MNTMYLYHFVPEHMQGTILYPLSELKHKFPELFREHETKYQGREYIKEILVPGLGGWNDVIHLSPIEPKKVIKALKEAGAAANFSWKAFLIEASRFDQSKLVIMVTQKNGDTYAKEFLPFNETNYLQNNEVPEITKQHYREAYAKGERPLTYAGAPHVLYKGMIDTKDLRTISS